MNDMERMDFVDRQCVCVSTMIQEAERTLDIAWAVRLYEMADDLLGVVAVAVRERPFPASVIGNLFAAEGEFGDMMACDEKLAALRGRLH